MKFFTESAVRCAARIGVLSELERLPDVSFETPLLLIYTKRGSVPHLTKDVLQMFTTEQHLLSVSLPSTITMADSIKQSNSFADFVSMKEYPNFLSIQDPAEKTSHGYQKNNAIAVWSKNGRHSLNADSYMDLVESFKPDIYVALCDGDTNQESSSKRVAKAVERSKAQFLRCMERHKSSDIIKNRGILGAVEGGYDLEARESCIKYLRDQELEGYIIDGLHVNGSEVQNIPFDRIKNVIEHTVNLLPVEKMKVSMGCWNPVVILSLIEHGIDIFDSSYPYVATESSKALTFMCGFHDHTNSQPRHEISIAEKSFADDFSPICESCECLTCKNHSRAYLNHLCHTKELLGHVLLMIHNTHQYLEFFKATRESLKNNTFKRLQSTITAQFDLSAKSANMTIVDSRVTIK